MNRKDSSSSDSSGDEERMQRYRVWAVEHFLLSPPLHQVRDSFNSHTYTHTHTHLHTHTHSHTHTHTHTHTNTHNVTIYVCYPSCRQSQFFSPIAERGNHLNRAHLVRLHARNRFHYNYPPTHVTHTHTHTLYKKCNSQQDN